MFLSFCFRPTLLFYDVSWRFVDYFSVIQKRISTEAKEYGRSEWMRRFVDEIEFFRRTCCFKRLLFSVFIILKSLFEKLLSARLKSLTILRYYFFECLYPGDKMKFLFENYLWLNYRNLWVFKILMKVAINIVLKIKINFVHTDILCVP